MLHAALIRHIMPFLPEKHTTLRKEPVLPVQIPLMPGVTLPDPPPSATPLPKPFITGDQLQQIVLNLDDQHANDLAAIMCRITPQYGLDDYNVFDDFIAQIAHESGGFRMKSENLNYTWQRLRQVFPKYFPTDAIAQQYHRQPESIANRVYAGRMGNGPEPSGDGWRFRGGGFIQLTGKEIWNLYSKYCGTPIDILSNLVRTDDNYAFDSACWYFSVHASLNSLALKDAFETITRRINGGLNGYQDRLDYYIRAKQVLSIADYARQFEGYVNIG